MTQQSHSQAYTEETKIERDTCIPLCTAALFTIARTWKQPKCPSTDEWIKKLRYICTMEYYSATKRNAFESVLMRWMNIEPVIQSEVNQKEKDRYHILTHVYGIQKNGTEEFTYRATIEKQTQRIDLWTWGEWRRGEERVRCMERLTWKLTLPYVKQIANGNLLYGSGNSNRERDSKGRGYMYTYG